MEKGTGLLNVTKRHLDHAAKISGASAHLPRNYIPGKIKTSPSRLIELRNHAEKWSGDLTRCRDP
ncbi:hypothetical protein E2C01_096059 [Portunus trituberculatus]|uniref:Uncharacterized protein n=1 Tax=Portunus trituberculatus TaxID=210409 RepID=A0A5B7K5M3_PORTR|nr:hypothetical protein [Portunus trituberculatus]